MYKEKKDRFFWFLIFLPIFLLATWFKDGLVLAGAEESFSIFHKINAIDKNSVWQESGLGFVQPVYSANIPITLFNQLNLNFGFSIFFVQMFFFYILIVTGTVSVYFLVKQLFCNFKDVNILAFCSSLFYLFNLYGLTQIWSRFLYSQMGIWAFLPLLTLLAIKYFRTNNFLYLFIIFISQVFFSFVYTIVVNVLLVIFVLFFIFFIDIFSTKKITKIKIFKALLVCATLITSNIWWISYNFLYIRGSFDNRIDHLTNFESLKSVSAYFPLQEILLLRQRFLLNQNFIWNFFYDSAFSYLLSVAILILFLVGLVNYWFKPVVRYLFYFFVIVLFFAKGANPPLGLEVYKFLFFSFPETAIFRNSYEKLGVLLLLPYSVFVSLGLLHLRNLGRYRFVLGIILIFALSYPMINGDVMRNFRVKIPYEYESLNSKVNAFTGCKNEGSRILVLPMINGDGAVYKWGYTGV
ncbi:MAG: hypothetical protein NZM26_02695, partial [Patescibacteria group bacterium]|nr:hypothetical protein [Patescibacteria group bacterium]